MKRLGLLLGIAAVLSFAQASIAQTTQPATSAVPTDAIAKWKSAQPELKKAELANIPKLIAQEEKQLREIAASLARTPEARSAKRERLNRQRDEIASLRARRNELLNNPSAVAYGRLGEMEMGTIGVPDRLAEFRVVQIIDGSNMLVDYWSADTVKTVVRRDGGDMADDSTRLSDLPKNSGFTRLLDMDTAKSVWLSGVPTNGLADGNWLPGIRIPLFVAGTRQFKTGSGGSRTVVYVAKFSEPATRSAER